MIKFCSFSAFVSPLNVPTFWSMKHRWSCSCLKNLVLQFHWYSTITEYSRITTPFWPPSMFWLYEQYHHNLPLTLEKCQVVKIITLILIYLTVLLLTFLLKLHSIYFDLVMLSPPIGSIFSPPCFEIFHIFLFISTNKIGKYIELDLEYV